MSLQKPIQCSTHLQYSVMADSKIFDWFQTFAGCEWCVLSFGWFHGVWIVCNDVSKHSVCSTVLKRRQRRFRRRGNHPTRNNTRYLMPDLTSEIFHVNFTTHDRQLQKILARSALVFIFLVFLSLTPLFEPPLQFQNVAVTEIRNCARHSHINLPNHVVLAAKKCLNRIQCMLFLNEANSEVIAVVLKESKSLKQATNRWLL